MRHLVTALKACLLYAIFISLYGNGRLWAQDVAIHEVSGTFTLSTNSDFSTDERAFDREETLYIRLNVLAVDFTGLELNESRLEPADNENEISILGTFSNHFDGTYTLEIDLSELPEVSFWTWTGIIEDDNGRGFIAEAKIVLGPPELASSELRITGAVEAVGIESLVIHDQTFRVTRITTILSEEGERLELEDIKVGDAIEAVATFNSGDQIPYTVFNVIRFDVDRIEEVAVTGDIAEVFNEAVVVQGLSFSVTGATKILGLDGNDADLEDFQPGTLVRVLGRFINNDELSATLLIEVDETRGGFTLEGIIESLNNESLIVEGTFFSITDKTVIINKDGVIIPRSALQQGSFVSIGAQLGNDGLPVSLYIKEEEGVTGSIFTRGSVDQISEERIVVQGRDFTVDAQTHVVDENGQLVSFNLLRVGLDVAIAGEYASDGELIATLITLGGETQNEVSLEGVIASRENDLIVVKELPFQLTEGTIIVDETGARKGLSDIVPGMFVELVGSSTEGEIFNAIKIESEDVQVSLDGIVRQSVEDRFYIGDIPFLIDEMTAITGPTGVEVDFESVLVGTLIHVEGTMISPDSLVSSVPGEDGTRVYRATEIEVLEDVAEFISVVGVISSKNDLFFTVEEFLFLVDEQIEVRNIQGAAISYDDINLGSVIEVRAVPLGESDYSAFLIQEKGSGPVKVSGTIESVLGSMVSVSGVDFELAEETEIFNTQGEVLSAGDLMQGMLVRAVLDQSGSGLRTARRMKVLQRIEDEVRVTGQIDAVQDNTIEVLSQTFYVLGNTQVVGVNNEILSLSDLSPGSIVRIRADLLPGNALVALKIRLVPASAEEVDVMGPIEEIEDQTLSVLGVPFLVDEFTLLQDVAGDSLLFDSLQPGNTVDVTAALQPDGSILASNIRLRDVMVASGMIAGISSSEIVLLGDTHRIDENTLILDERNNPTLLETLQTGLFVEIRGVSGEDDEAESTFQVTKIKQIRDRQVQPISIEDPEEGSLPARFILHQNYPNPFNASTTLRFDLKERGAVTLEVYSVMGHRIRTLHRGLLVAGEHLVEWDGRNDVGLRVASGVYFYRIQVGVEAKVGKMLMVK